VLSTSPGFVGFEMNVAGSFDELALAKNVETQGLKPASMSMAYAVLKGRSSTLCGQPSVSGEKFRRLDSGAKAPMIYRFIDAAEAESLQRLPLSDRAFLKWNGGYRFELLVDLCGW
jgi:hypothetical protein